MGNRHLFAPGFSIVLFFGAAVGLPPGSRAQLSSSSRSSREDASDEAAFEMVCGACHPTSLVNGLRSAAKWDQTVDLMESIGAKETDEQFDRVMRFLLRNLTQVNMK